MSSAYYNNISNLTGTSGTTKSASTSSTTSLGKEDFMKLLIAQLKNQNPLNPMEGTDFAVQLAQFSSLEQLTNLNSEIKTQGINQLTLGYAQSVNMIGKEIIAQNGNTVTIDGISSVDLNYQLAGTASAIKLSVYDQNGKLVKSIEDTGKSEGLNTTTLNCSGLPQGEYTFDVAAVDAKGESVSSSALVSGKVSAVHFKNNAITLTVNGRELALSDVVSVKQD